MTRKVIFTHNTPRAALWEGDTDNGLKRINFSRLNLDGADIHASLSYSDLTGTTMRNARVGNPPDCATWEDIGSLVWLGKPRAWRPPIEIESANFSQADFENTHFWNVRFINCKWDNCNLNGATFRNCTFVMTQPKQKNTFIYWDDDYDTAIVNKIKQSHSTMIIECMGFNVIPTVTEAEIEEISARTGLKIQQMDGATPYTQSDYMMNTKGKNVKFFMVNGINRKQTIHFVGCWER